MKKLKKNLLYITAFVPMITFAQQQRSGICTPIQGRFITCDGPECTISHLICSLGLFLKFLIQIAFAVFVVYIVYVGYLLMTSGADPGKRTKAKNSLVNIAWGMFWILCAYLVVNLLLNTLGYTGSTIKLSI